MDDEEHNNSDDIAIVGIAGRFPGAADVEQYWENLLGGKVESTVFSAQELLDAGVLPEHVENDNFVPQAPVLENAERFDAEFFNYAPYEAELIDPQQRQLLEVAWQAIEDAGYDPARIDGRVATFAGTAINTYILHTGLAKHFFENYLPTLLGSDKDYTATRIAYKLGLNGPAATVQSACSTSLVAIHLARQCLLEGEADFALVGAASVRCPLKTGHLYQEGSVFSPDGVCRPFDASAGGTVFGSGAGAVLLKRLTDAEEAGDNIYAVIKGTAVNNDGNTKSDFTAPTVLKQAEVVVDALDAAEVNAGTISYVEAHGTGTYLGDPIEIEALTKAYRLDTDSNGYCGIGSVKGNIGHLDAAAGMASLIKVTKSLQEKVLPASGNYQAPNPQIDFDSTPFNVVAKNTEWAESPDHLRRAGISALGMGGTNSHIVVEEYVGPAKSGANPHSLHLLPLSAASPQALKKMVARLSDHLSNNPDANLNDIAFTLQQGRKTLPYRAAVVAGTINTASARLENAKPPLFVKGYVPNSKRSCPVTLMFPGQGSQYSGMGAALYESELVFRQYVDIAEKVAKDETDFSIVDTLCNEHRSDINDTRITQPALYVTSYAYAKLLQNFGVQANRLVGHSIGEFVAAALAGVFSFEDGLRLVIARGRLMQAAPVGDMLMVASASGSVQSMLPHSVELAAVNSTSTCVVGGPSETVAGARELFEAKSISCRVLKTSHAFHTSMMEHAAAEFQKVVEKVELCRPSIPFISCVSGDWIRDEDCTSAEYWARQIRSPVNFATALTNAFTSASTGGLFVEAGPGVVLTQLANSHADCSDDHVVLSTGRHPKVAESERDIAYAALARIWTAGGAVNWGALCPSGTRVSLPVYPFEGKAHWYERATADKRSASEVSLSTRPEDWVWRESWAFVKDDNENEDDKSYFIFDPKKMLTGLSDALHVIGQQAQHFSELEQLHEALTESKSSQTKHVVFAPAVDNYLASDDVLGLFRNDFETLRNTAELLDAHIQLSVVQFGSLPVLDASCDDTKGALIAGMLPVFDAEYHNLQTQYIDIADSADFQAALALKLTSKRLRKILCLKNNLWWTRIYEQLPLPDSSVSWLQPNTCHVVVGAFGGIGRHIVDTLGKGSGKLILVGRSTAKRLEYVSTLQRSDLEVTLLECDITHERACEKLRLELENSKDYASGYVFHLAGVTADGLISSKDITQTDNVLKPKVHGTRNLYQAIKNTEMKLVLFSSTAAIAGPVGQVDYAAANAFQLSFGQNDERVISIGWPGWKKTGLLSKVNDPAALEKIEKTALNPKFGLKVLDRLLALQGITQPVVVSAVSPDCLIVESSEKEKRTASQDQHNDTEVLTEPDDIVAHELKNALKLDDIALDDHILSLGGSSLMVVSVLSQIRTRYGVTIPLNTALSKPIVSEWGRLYREALGNGTNSGDSVDDESALRVGGAVLPVAGISRFITRRAGSGFSHWNLAVMLESVGAFDKTAMQQAMVALVNHHDMLRAKIDIRGTDDYSITVRSPVDKVLIDTIDVSMVDDQGLKDAIEQHADKVQQQFVLAESMLFRCVHFACGADRPDRLLFLVHHFVADGLSWTIILTDIQNAYKRLVAGDEVSLPEKTTSYQDWASQVTEIASSTKFAESAEDWLGLPWDRVKRIPLNCGSPEENLNVSGADIQIELDKNVSAALLRVNNCGSIEEMLVAGLAQALVDWSGLDADDPVLIDLLGHGRSIENNWDVMRTVGFFNSYTPTLIVPTLVAGDSKTLRDCCARIRSMAVRENEFEHGKYISKDAAVREKIRRLPSSEVLFNYIGNLKNSNENLLDSDLFEVAAESFGNIHGASAKRDHLLAVRVEQVDEQLVLTLVYSSNIHTHDSMSDLLNHYVEQLKNISKIEGS